MHLAILRFWAPPFGDDESAMIKVQYTSTDSEEATSSVRMRSVWEINRISRRESSGRYTFATTAQIYDLF